MPGIDAQTVLCLHCDTPLPKPVTATGSAAITTATSMFGGASLYVPFVAGSFVSTPDHADFEFCSSTDFTIDFWYRANVFSGGGILAAKRPSQTGFGPFTIYRDITNIKFYASSNGTSWDVANGQLFASSPSGWHHYAITRSGTTFQGFLDGVQVFTFTSSATLLDNTAAVSFGGDLTGANILGGWLDEVRISKGIARWTSNFTPPAAPYTPDANTALLLHCDGAEGSIVVPDALVGDVSQYNHPVTAYGNAQVDTAQSKFGGASMLFDGSGDYLSTPDSADWAFGSGDFTIDFWMRINVLNDYDLISQTGSPNAFRVLFANFNKYLRFDYSPDGSSWVILQQYWSPSTGVWYHIAIVRSGTAVRHFVNGTQVGPDITMSVAIADGNGALTVGGSPGAGTYFNGWLDEVRISKGVARWTANFTPPTAPYDSLGGPSYTDTPSGGLVLGGSITDTQLLALTPSGGVVLGGSITDTRLLALTPSGGIVFGGSVVQAKVYTAAPSAGVILNGSCSSSLTVSNAYYDTPSGGVVLGGSQTNIRTLALTRSAGVVLGGSVVIAYAGALAQAGGIVLGGTQTSARTLGIAQSGGLILGGSVATAQTSTLARTAGIVLNGTCVAGTTTSGVTLGKARLRLKAKPIQVALSRGCAIVGTFQVGAVKVGECNYIVRKAKLKLKAGHYVFWAGAAPTKATPGKAKLRLVAKPLVFSIATGIVYVQPPKLRLKGKAYEAIEPQKQSPHKSRIRLKGKTYVLRQTQRYAVGKPKLILRGKAPARTGQAGLVPSPPRSLILTPTVPESGPILVPTAPESTLLVPTTRRSI